MIANNHFANSNPLGADLSGSLIGSSSATVSPFDMVSSSSGQSSASNIGVFDRSGLGLNPSIDSILDAHRVGSNVGRTGAIDVDYYGDDTSTESANDDYMSYLEGLFSSVGQQNELNRIYNAEQAQLNRDFNASEAEKSRQWSERMSNTAYQRAVEDLQKAGLNPILAYQQGGSSTPSSSSATGTPASYQTGGGDTFSSLIKSFAYLISSSAHVLDAFLPG